jgi:hypothetical protein
VLTRLIHLVRCAVEGRAVHRGGVDVARQLEEFLQREPVTRYGRPVALRKRYAGKARNIFTYRINHQRSEDK